VVAVGGDEVDLVGTEQDDALLLELRAVAAVRDAVPEAVLAAARDSLTWRTIDAELAALAFDSLADAGALVRDGAATRDYRLLTFEAGQVSLEVEISGTGSRLRLSAQIVPGAVASVEVRSPAGTTTTTTDEHGRLAPVDVAPGPVSLRVVRSDGTTFVTEWVTA
jgi:hypothetical protein